MDTESFGDKALAEDQKREARKRETSLTKPPARATSANKPPAKKKEVKKINVKSQDEEGTVEKDGGEVDEEIGMFEIQDEDDEGDQNFQGAGAADSDKEESDVATPPRKSAASRGATEQSGSKS